MTTYKKAPIVEALIQIQFSENISENDMGRIAKKAQGDYPVSNLMKDFNVEVRVTNGAAIPGVSGTRDWHRMSSKDGADIFVVNRNQFTTACLAPYASWNTFFKRFSRDFETVSKVLGYRKVERIGVRFVNRIDAPSRKGQGFDVRNYLNVYPCTPHIPPEKMTNTQVRFEHPDEKTASMVLVTTGNVDPVLLNHDSYLLDIDVVKTQGISMKRDELLDQVDALRHTKNEMFEALITDNSRALFNA